MLTDDEFYQEQITLDRYKRRRDPQNYEPNVLYFETAWSLKPKSVKKERDKNINVLDLRWGNKGL